MMITSTIISVLGPDGFLLNSLQVLMQHGDFIFTFLQ